MEIEFGSARVLIVGYLLALGAGVWSIPLLARRRALQVIAVFALVTAGVTLLRISEPPDPFNDFDKAYYPAGAAVLEDPAALTPLLGRGLAGFVNIPVVAYAFAPLAAMPLRYAHVAFTVLSVAAVVLAWRSVIRLVDPSPGARWQILLLFAAGGPLANSLKAGNTSQFGLLALVVAWRLLRQARPTAAGALIGAASVMKLPLLIFVPYFFLKRLWRSAAAVAAVWAAALLLSVALVGWRPTGLWLREFVVGASSRTAGAFNVQSLAAAIVRLRSDVDILRDWSYVTLTPVEHAVTMAGLAVLCGVGWFGLRHWPGQDRMDREFLVVTTLATIGSPIVWTHYYCWLLLPLAWLWARPAPSFAGGVVRAVATLFVSAPVLRLSYEHPLLMSAYLRAGASAWFVGGVLCLLLLIWRARTAPAALPARPHSRGRR